jgi:hypothetical protein
VVVVPRTSYLGLLTTRADAAKAALAATVAARDANLAREILERALCDLPVLTGARG